MKKTILIIILIFLSLTLSGCYSSGSIPNVMAPAYEQQVKDQKRINKARRKDKRVHKKRAKEIKKMQNKSLTF